MCDFQLPASDISVLWNGFGSLGIDGESVFDFKVMEI